MEMPSGGRLGKMFYRRVAAVNEKRWSETPRPLSLSNVRDLK
ncbi:hypothetical protein AB395_0000995 [Sinorhizobium fredii CCBAU 45436]|nr:hypothetical protein SF83666_c09620 [Sinorhizobium fredii CCBAU 83666]AWI56671.1 hypothetical protein AB395_0000995 [Sinorhizobium fredii CCBAU 45436]